MYNLQKLKVSGFNIMYFTLHVHVYKLSGSYNLLILTSYVVRKWPCLWPMICRFYTIRY